MARVSHLVFLKGRMNVRVNITLNRGIYWICKRIWFYDRVYMPTTLPNDPLCIHAMQICHCVVRSHWLSGAPICWTREHIICSWYQNIMTCRGEKNGFHKSDPTCLVKFSTGKHICPLQPDSELISGLIPNFQVIENRHTPLALTVKPHT